MIASVLLVLASLMAALNLMYAWQDYSNRRRGIKRHVSMVPLVAQIFVLLAWLMYKPTDGSYLSPLIFIGIAVSDLSLWNLIALPFRRKG